MNSKQDNLKKNQSTKKNTNQSTKKNMIQNTNQSKQTNQSTKKSGYVYDLIDKFTADMLFW